MAIVLTTVLSQVLMEFAVDGTGGAIAYTFAEYISCLFSLTLIIAYIIGYTSGKGDHVLHIAVAFLNSYYFIFLPYALIEIIAPPKFYTMGFSTLTQELIPVWGFLIMFRITNITCSAELKKLVMSGLLATGALCLLNSQIYFNRIYYVEPPAEQEESSPLDNLTSEELFNMQEKLRQASLSRLTVSKPGQIDIYALSLAPYAYQSVFMRDVRYADARLKDKLGITNIISMINNKRTVQTTALANVTNLKDYLDALSSRFMQPKEDIALIFMSSHGSAKNGLAVNLEYQYSQMDISPQRLKKILKDSGIQNKIIVISACFSGVFIPYLKDEHTMVITAAAPNRVSFGCSDTQNLTYFTQAYFMDGLSQTTDLEKAFNIAKKVVLKREKSMGIKIHSNPQIFIGRKIKAILENYKAANIASPD